MTTARRASKVLTVVAVLCVLAGGAAQSITAPRIGAAMPSLQFNNATSDRVTTATNVGLGSTFTVIVWAYPTSHINSRAYFTQPLSSDAKRMFMGDGGTGQIRVRVGRATTQSVYNSTTTPVSNNAWNCVAASYDEAATPPVAIYHGTLTALATATGVTEVLAGAGSTTAESGGATIGSEGASSSFPGLLSRVMAFSRVLTEREVAQQCRWPANLPGVTRLNMPLGWSAAGTGTQPDLSGNGNHGTVTGATLVMPNAPIGRYP